MILVTAANGHLGSKTLEFLTSKVPTTSLAAMVRNEEKAKALQTLGVDIRIGDYTNSASLATAFAGIDTLLLISSGTLQNRVMQHENAINAARGAGIKHIIYTSVVEASPDLTNIHLRDHYDTEEMIRESGMTYTIFRNTFYADLIPMTFGNALTTGIWSYPAGQAKINVATRSDIAEALANVLSNPAIHGNKIYEIAAEKSHTFHELAERVSVICNVPIRYNPISSAIYQSDLTAAGVPDMYIPFMMEIAEGIAAGEFSAESLTLRALLGRNLEDIRDTLANLLSQK